MIVALGHRKFVGKDSVAKILLETYDTYNPKTISFAYPLKKLSYDLYSWTGLREPEYYDRLPGAKSLRLAPLNMTVRELWIKVGMMFREIHGDTWAYPAIELAKKQRVAIITDLRFPNEAKLLKEAGAILVKITRPQLRDTDDAADCALQDFNDWDINFVNGTTTLAALKKQVKSILVPQLNKRAK